MMEHPRPGPWATGNLALAGDAQPVLRRIAVMAPDDAPGLAALRERLGAWPALDAEHHAAGFHQPASAALPEVFERILERHRRQAYDALILLDGRADALGIAESMRMIPEQLRSMPMPVWSAIGEDDANTEIGDVAARTFSSPGALLNALQRCIDAAPRAASATAVTWLPVPHGAPSEEPPAAGRPRTHPLVLCAAAAVILASMTAIAGMLGVLPDFRQPAPAQPVLQPTSGEAAKSKLLPTSEITVAKAKPAAAAPMPAKATMATMATTAATAATAPIAPAPASAQTPAAADAATLSAKTAPLAEPSDQAPPAASDAPQPVAAPVAPSTAAPSAVERERPRAAAAGPPATRHRLARRSARHRFPVFAQAQTPRRHAPGSEEVPSFNFVGVKTRAQVRAELLASRRPRDASARADNTEFSKYQRRYQR